MEECHTSCNRLHPHYRRVVCQKTEGHGGVHAGQIPKRGYWVEWSDGPFNRHGFPVFQQSHRTRQPPQPAGPRRARLFKQDPHCFWCGVLTIWRREFPLTPDTATVDHLYSKLHPERGQQHAIGRFEDRYVLACWKCNKARGEAEVRGEVFKPVLDARADMALATSAVAYRKGLVEPLWWLKKKRLTRTFAPPVE